MDSPRSISPVAVMDSIVKQEEPFEPFPKFDIFATDDSEKIAGYIKGSPVNHTQWTADTLKSAQLNQQLKNISTLDYTYHTHEYYLKNYEKMLWSIDQLKNATPNVNWDKILTGIFGRANVTDKIFIGDVNFIKRFDDVIKNADKRLFNNLSNLIINVIFFAEFWLITMLLSLQDN